VYIGLSHFSINPWPHLAGYELFTFYRRSYATPQEVKQFSLPLSVTWCLRKSAKVLYTEIMRHILPRISSTSRAWLPIAVVITLLCGTFYGAFQQHIRSEADQPQMMLAEDVAAQLYKNEQPSASLPFKEVDVASSLAPFIILYDINGKPTDGSGKLDGQLPSPPKGVFEYTSRHVGHRVTWQPKPRGRIAAVIRYYQNPQHAGYVLSGRNLAESERQQSHILLIASLGWAGTLITSYLLVMLKRGSRDA
jgi:hypothetical protein